MSPKKDPPTGEPGPASHDLVELARALQRDAGMGYRRIAKRLGLNPYTVRDWLRYKRRPWR